MKIKGLEEKLKEVLGGQENQITNLKQDNQKKLVELESKDNELKEKDEQITKKNDRLALLNKILTGSITVFRGRQQRLTGKIQELAAEQAKNTDNLASQD